MPRTAYAHPTLGGRRAATYRDQHAERCECGAWLSAYNPETRCGPCVRGDREDEMNDRQKVLALLQKHPGEAIRRSRMAAATGLSQRSVAQHISRLEHECIILVDRLDGEVAYIYHPPRANEPDPSPACEDEPPCETTPPNECAKDRREDGTVVYSILETSAPGDPEVVALTRCVEALMDLYSVAQVRVLDYLTSRFI